MSAPAGGAYHTVAPREAGLRLDRWFRGRFPGLGHGRLAKLLRKGQVRLDGARVAGGARLEAGQRIRIPPLPAAALEPPAAPGGENAGPAERAFLEGLLLHRDDSVLVLNKPAGLAVQGGSGVRRHLDGMLAALRLGGAETPRLAHRLDRDVSGVLALGRSSWAAARLCAAFRERRARKLYWALTLGVPSPERGEVRSPLEKRGVDGRERMTAGAGRPACTRYAVIEAVASRLAWVAFMPESGRTHQLRVHAAALGTPILGDGKYGGREARRLGAQMGLGAGLHLHARRLCLPHPEGGMLDVSAPPPAHMAQSWRTLEMRGHGAEDGFALFSRQSDKGEEQA